jgi:DNA-binding transcriptional regulator YdaS (Cro superfamily)
MHALMTDSDIIDKLGGTAEVARRLRISSASVSEMRKKGIPDGRKLELGADIERATGGVYARWHLRPNDWYVIWPELIGAEGAPPVPLGSPKALQAPSTPGEEAGKGLSKFAGLVV